MKVVIDISERQYKIACQAVKDGRASYMDRRVSRGKELTRCKDCEWFGHVGCAIYIVDDSDKPKENDFCSFAERRTGAK